MLISPELKNRYAICIVNVEFSRITSLYKQGIILWNITDESYDQAITRD